MKRTLFTLLAVGLTALGVNAQENKLLQGVKLSGYAMVRYQATEQDGAKDNTFGLRLARVALDGHAYDDFYYKLQMQVNGNIDNTAATNSSSIRLLDLFGEWQKFDFLRVKAGQFARPFTFENPLDPISQGFMAYSQNVTNLAGFVDRTGEQASDGRDIGVQLQGDFLKTAKGRNLLHYEVGVFNGQGINTRDADNNKDLIGGLWVMPVEGLRIGAFGWTGSRGQMTYEEYAFDPTLKKNVKVEATEDVRKNRYAFSAEYAKDDWTIRSEYIHSQGKGNSVIGEDLRASDKADGLYALCIVPVIKNKLHAKARYDVYRAEANWSVRKIMYEAGVDYVFGKNLQVSLEYARVNDHQRTFSAKVMNMVKNTYNVVDLELDFRF